MPNGFSLTLLPWGSKLDETECSTERGVMHRNFAPSTEIKHLRRISPHRQASSHLSSSIFERRFVQILLQVFHRPFHAPCNCRAFATSSHGTPLLLLLPKRCPPLTVAAVGMLSPGVGFHVTCRLSNTPITSESGVGPALCAW